MRPGDVPDELSDEELLAWINERRGDTFDRVSRLAGIRDLLVDLETAVSAYTRDDQIACQAASLAVYRLCYRLGRPELAMPFKVLANGIGDLRDGLTPDIFRRAQPGGKSGEGSQSRKPRGYREMEIRACAVIHLLMKVAKLPSQEAEEEVAKILKKYRIDFGRLDKPLAITLRRKRLDISAAKCPDEVHKRYLALCDDLQTFLDGLQDKARKEFSKPDLELKPEVFRKPLLAALEGRIRESLGLISE